MVLFTTSFEAVHTLHTLSDYGREDGFVASSSAIASIAGLFWVFLFAEVAVASVGPGTACIATVPVASPAAVAACMVVYWLWMSSAYKILRSADPSSKFPVCGKEAGWYRSTIQVIRSLFGWIVVFSNASSVKCWIQGCDGRDGRWIGWEFHDG